MAGEVNLLAGFHRVNPFALDDSSVYNTDADIDTYIAGGLAYQGQVVYSKATNTLFKIDLSGTSLIKVAVGSGALTNGVTFTNAGGGATSGTTFTGASAVTVSYNTIGAQQASTNLDSLAGLIYNGPGNYVLTLTGANTFALTPSTSFQASGTYVTSVAATSPVLSSGGIAPTISLNSGYGDTLNPYASKTANYFLAAPNATAGQPTFRAILAADIPILNQNTTGTAGSIASGAANQILYQTGSGVTSFITAPTSGSTYLRWTGSAFDWYTPTGGGDVTGPTSSIDNELVLFDGTTGKLIKRSSGSGFVKVTSGVVSYDSNTYYLASNPNGYTSNTGTVTSIATTGPITGGPITGSGTIGINQATTSTDGYLSSTDWNTFNNKLSSVPLATNSVTGGIKLVDNTTQTVTANSVTTTANRTYAVQLDSSNQAVVNVPWTDTNTTYTFATGSTNGTFQVTPSGGSAQSVSIFGLGSAAYTPSTDYATSTHTHGYVLSGGTMTTSVTATNPVKVVITSSSDALGLLTTTNASNTTFLRGDGTWATPSGGGITALTGDVTASGTGSVTAAIANTAVTYAKIQNVTANTFLANITGSPVTVQEIATNRIPLFSSAITGTPSSTTYLAGNGSWATISGGGSPATFDSGNETPVSKGTAANSSGLYTYTLSNIPKFINGDIINIRGFTTNTRFNLSNVAVSNLTLVRGVNRSSAVSDVTTTTTQTTYTVTNPFLVTDTITISGLTHAIFNRATAAAPASVTSTTVVYNNSTGNSLSATLTPGANTVTLPSGQTTRGLRIGQPVVTVSSSTSNFAAAATIATITGAQTFTMSANHTGTAAATVYFLPSNNATHTTANTNVTTNQALTCNVATTGTITITGAGQNTYGLYIGQRIYQSNTGSNTATGLPTNTSSTVTITTITSATSFTVSQTTGLTARTGSTLTTIAPAISSSIGAAAYDLVSKYTFEATDTAAGPLASGTTESPTAASAYIGTKYTITAASADGTNATYTTGTTAHGFSVGDTVVIDGITPSSYNGAGIVTAVTSFTFTINNNTAAGTTWTSGGSVLRQGYTTGTIPGNKFFDLLARNNIRTVKPKAGSWITTTDLHIGDASNCNSISIASGNSYRILSLFTLPYTVNIQQLAIIAGSNLGTGGEAMMGIYKMVAPDYTTGYLISPNSTFISIAVPSNTAASGIVKSVTFPTTSTVKILAGDVYGIFIACKTVASASGGIGTLDISPSWAAFGTPTTGTPLNSTSLGPFALNFGSSFYQTGAPSVYPTITTLPSNLDTYQTLTSATVGLNPLVYLKTI